jgi:hypothetical protein
MDRGVTVHLILDNKATHKRPDVKYWVTGHSRPPVHFKRAISCWLNKVGR